MATASTSSRIPSRSRKLLKGEPLSSVLLRFFLTFVTLVQMDSKTNHVHLLVNYPPKVSVSSLVNSLKGVSSYVLRRQLPRIAKCYSEKCSVVAFLFRRIMWRRTARSNQALH
jgi:Transposase IS200 like